MGVTLFMSMPKKIEKRRNLANPFWKGLSFCVDILRLVRKILAKAYTKYSNTSKINYKIKIRGNIRKQSDCNPETNGETNFIKSIINECNIVFDVGAADDHTLFLNPQAEYHLFEPSPEFYSQLSTKISDKKNVIINNFGLGNKNGNALLDAVTRSIIKRSHGMSSGAELKQIQIRKLDDYCEEKNIQHIDFIKIDTEGYDFEVLKGGRNIILSNCKYVQFEYNDIYLYWLEQNGRFLKLADIYDYFKEWYIYLIEADCLHYLPRPIDDYKYSNYVASKKKLH